MKKHEINIGKTSADLSSDSYASMAVASVAGTSLNQCVDYVFGYETHETLEETRTQSDSCISARTISLAHEPLKRHELGAEMGVGTRTIRRCNKCTGSFHCGGRRHFKVSDPGSMRDFVDLGEI